ncbi:hypothetical protein [Streptomyces albidocamelliae]|uniref:Conjugal transfer protein TraB n=1 Tax=Streptomyces albidocamelliae TaxID=2981135 RepID=A0ABY6F1I4_9ACTN|nr:hypothetical protein [Streptomyces sp. HUAS 14-6]UXY40515.1 hypothetical protein N8I86_38795 [Streptomyces sp. HUAS 14-6]
MGQIAPVGDDGDANGYMGLATKFTALQTTAAHLLEHAELIAQRMRANAATAVRVAELSAAAEVDPAHVAAVTDVAGAFGRVVGGCKNLMGAVDGVHQAAGNLKAEHRAEYGAIHDAATASKARQARPGFYQLP